MFDFNSLYLQDSPTASINENNKTKAEDVIVKGTKNNIKSDRVIYDAKSDEENRTLNIGEVLNKAPGVTVDDEGALALRGDKNVKLLINGREMLSSNGENRAMLLLSGGGENIDAIEIMTNPSAQYSADGSGGIINIITKKGSKFGDTARLRFFGSSNKGNGVSFGNSQTIGKFNLTNSFEIRGGENSSDQRFIRIPDFDIIENSNIISNSSRNKSNLTSLGLSSNLEYNVNDKNIIGLEVSAKYKDIDSKANTGGSNYNSFNLLKSNYARNSFNNENNLTSAVTLYWNHLNDINDGLKVAIGYENRRSKNSKGSETDTIYVSGKTKQSNNNSLLSNKTSNIKFNADYKTEINNAQFSAGLSINHETGDRNSNYKNKVDNEWQENSKLSNVFAYDENEYAAYVTQELPIGERINSLLGLRYEYWEVKNGNLTNKSNGIYPSLHITYNLKKGSNLRLSYTQRLQRPAINDLNPFVIYRNNENWSSGNFNLKESRGKNLELSYDINRNKTNKSVSLHYKTLDDVIANSYQIAGDNIILSSKENLGEIKEYGLDVSYSSQLSKQLKAALSFGIRHIATDAESELFEIANDGVGYDYKLLLNYKMTGSDSFTFNISSTGRQINIDDTRLYGTVSNISYNHKFSKKVSLTAAVQNPLGNNKRKIIRNSYLFDDYMYWENPKTIFKLSLAFNLK